MKRKIKEFKKKKREKRKCFHVSQVGRSFRELGSVGLKYSLHPT